jgi:hypothetical protein
LDFDETWLASCWLHLNARKNKFSSKKDHNFEFHSKRKFGLISREFESETLFLNFAF